MKNNILIVTILLAINCGINAADFRNQHEKDLHDQYEKILKDQEYDTKVGNFFERSPRQKTFEMIEHEFTPKNLNFFLSQDHLDPKKYSYNMCQYAKEFSRQLQVAIAKVIQKCGDEAINKNNLSRISKHAISQCHHCADLELKRRKGQSLGTVPASYFTIYTQGDAHTFYDNACGDLYKNLSDEKLQHIVEVTK